MRGLPIRVEPNDLWANIELEFRARKRHVAAYDDAYLDLAVRRNLTLATSDGGMKRAALAEGIEVLGNEGGSDKDA